MSVRPILWRGGVLSILDQRRLPHRLAYIDCRNCRQVAAAIRTLAVRGAPLIGIAGAYGLALAAARFRPSRLAVDFDAAYRRLGATRPTAVNLFWALDRMRRVFQRDLAAGRTSAMIRKHLAAEARLIHRQDAATCDAIGKHGAGLLPKGSRILTHCNSGALATGGIGTALGIIITAHRQGRVAMVYVDETRPLLQGSRLTAWELQQGRVPATLICDNMAASLMSRGLVDAVLVGADRIVGNGDFANKIGTYGLAVLARHHRIPFYVAAPASTFDRAMPHGSRIEVEERSPDEVRGFCGKRTTTRSMPVFNPAFDVTPGTLVSAFIMEQGIIRPPYRITIASNFKP